MKILFISTLYPSSVHPTQAAFNRQLIGAIALQLEENSNKKVEKDGKKDCMNASASQENSCNVSHLCDAPEAHKSPPRRTSVGSTSFSAFSCQLSAFLRVVAPVYWLPGRKLPPTEEVLDGITVTHPKVFYTPGILREKHGAMYRCSIKKHLRSVVDEFKPNHVIIGFAYPDAVAVAPLCRELGIDYSIRVNGSDFRLRVKQDGFREMVLDELNRAPKIFCPGKALKRDMVAEGIDEAKITSFNNGVAGQSRKQKAESRKLKEEKLGTRLSLNNSTAQQPNNSQPSAANPDTPIPPYSDTSSASADKHKLILFVGHLIDVKGPDVMLEAWKSLSVLPDLPVKESPHLVFIGDGGMRKSLEQRVKCEGLQDSVMFLGDIPHDQVFEWMRKADCLCLTSRSEGMPNVVVEALACGLPVVATDVGEVPFLVEDDVNGYVVGKAESRKQKADPTGGREGRRVRRATQWQIGREETPSRLPKDIANAIEKVLGKKWDHAMISERMKDYTWANAADTILEALT